MSSEDFRPEGDRRCGVTISGRPGANDGPLRCIFVKTHKVPHRFMAPDATLAWWPVGLGAPPSWDDAIHTPATDPRWPSGAPHLGVSRINTRHDGVSS